MRALRSGTQEHRRLTGRDPVFLGPGSRASRSAGMTIMALPVRLSRAQILAGERAADQPDRCIATVERGEGAEARPLALAEQHLVERLEPVAQRLAAVRVARGMDLDRKSGA